ncbi:MAG: dihydrolipoyl dehydrogenase [Deltaproteobacteria bacterium]|nr:dihydrolipoyl dehydrogenase [Deltaproteobacteria bacterium]
MAISYEAVVVGGGPGGYVCGIRLGQFGKKTLVIDAGKLGGVCLNVGCIPSKALIHATKTYKKAKDGAVMGVIAKDIAVDLKQMVAWKDGITAKLSGGVGQLLKANKVDVLQGQAVLDGPGRLRVSKPDGTTETVHAQAIVLATGSSPIQIPGFTFDHQTILDSTDALALTEIPARMAVIGGGVIGLELGEVYARIGTQVTVVEAAERVLPFFDADVVRPLQQKHAKLGIKYLVSHKAKGWRPGEGGGAVLQLEDGKGQPVELAVDKVLVAVGRRPNSAGLGLETVGLQADARGFIGVDKQLRTSVPGLYAIGDVAGAPMLAHKASREGEVVAEVIAGHKGAAMDVACIPNVVYTDPEIATVGPTLAELDKAGVKYKTGKFNFGALGRALTANAGDGFARIVTGEKGDILAVHIVGPEASELIAEAGLAVEMAATAEDIALTVHAHPTLAEAMLEAALAATGQPLHQVPTK